MIALLVITDGRDAYLDPCIESTHHLHGPLVERWMFDDTGDETYRRELARKYPGFRHINAGPRQGCAGAFRSAWEQVRAGTRARFVFLLEQDFIFGRPVDLVSMAGLLDERPYLVQVALRRQPWNEAEKAAGGVVEQHPDWYVDHRDDQGREWLEHRIFFTTNPSLFRASLLTVPWPAHQAGAYSEGTFHQDLLAHGTPEALGRHLHYAYWGRRDSGVWVQHIGHQRIGKDY